MSKLRFVLFFVFTPHLCAAQDEVYVLFRGFHFGPTQTVPVKSNINGYIGQDCKSPYTHFSKISNASAERKAKRAMLLRETGRIVDNQQIFPSAYDWMQQYYVNEYADFKEELKNPQSRLRICLRNKSKIECNDVFLISTSIDPLTALKYAVGMCSPAQYRRFPVDDTSKIINPVLGFLDIFMIPAPKIQQYYPYFVVEEFARHHIEIPHKFKQKNYTLAEEVNFPFLIPGEYHVSRIAADVSSFPFLNWEDKDACLRTYLRKIADIINQRVCDYLLRLRKTRVYLGPLTNILQKRSFHLVPSTAVSIRNRIAAQVASIAQVCFDPQTQRLHVSKINLDFCTAHALQVLGFRGYPLDVHLRFPLKSSKTKFLPIIFEAPNLVKLFLEGKDKDGVIKYPDYDPTEDDLEEVVDIEDFENWRIPNEVAMESIIESLSKRNSSVVFNITGQSLHPSYYDYLNAAVTNVEIIDENRDSDEFLVAAWIRQHKTA